MRRRCGVVAAVCCGSGRTSNGPTRFSGVAAGLFVSSSGFFNHSTVGYTKKMKSNAIVGAVSSFSKFVSLFQKVQKTVEAHVQYICWIVDMTVCYNIKTAIQTVWNSGGTSGSVVVDWWTSLCDAKTGACVQLLDCSHEVSGFAGWCRSPGSASDKKSTLGARQMATSLENAFSTAMEKNRKVDLRELFADRARVRDDPGMRARSRRTI